MMDFSQVMTQKSDTIVKLWVQAVCEDEQIEATQELPYTAVRDSMPRVLNALATVLSESQSSDLQSLVNASLEHGTLRANQGFEPAEIAREYRLLRSVIFQVLEADLLQATPIEMLRAVRLIDTVIDEAIARCFNSYTKERLTELSQLQSQLKLTNQELTRLVRASKENLSHLAHELKTPLTSIIGYTDLVLRQQRQNPNPRDISNTMEHMERVLRSGRLLLRLINDALDISRYDAGQMVLHLVPASVNELFSSVVEIVEPLAHAKALMLTTNYNHAPTEVVTDPLRLQQIVTNLLSNAIRYTESGFVHLECRTIGDHHWEIVIADSGRGISEEDQHHLFEPYFRSSSPSLEHQTQGTGLGLAIASRLVTLLQGRIRLTSELGQGTTFTVQLPIRMTEEAHPPDGA